MTTEAKKDTKTVYKIHCLTLGYQYESAGFFESVEEFLTLNPSFRNPKRRMVRDLKSVKEVPIDSTELIS